MTQHTIAMISISNDSDWVEKSISEAEQLANDGIIRRAPEMDDYDDELPSYSVIDEIKFDAHERKQAEEVYGVKF